MAMSYGAGVVVTDFGSGDYGTTLAAQADGSLLFLGSSGYSFALARYDENGNIDTQFATNGMVTTVPAYGFTMGNDVTVQSDGRILAVGTSAQKIALVRYNAEGGLDTTFGTNGVVLTEYMGADSGRSVLLQSDGKIIVAGDSYGDLLIARYNTDGSIDTTFGSAGLTQTHIYSDYDFATNAVLQTDGKILVSAETNGNLALVRYNTNGSLDTTFGNAGIVVPDLGGNEKVYGLVLQPDGKIVLSGKYNNDVVLVRYNTDGTLDSGFGDAGFISHDLGGNRVDESYALALQDDGKLVSVGYSGLDMAIIRYNTNGTLDETFGNDGYVITRFDANEVLTSVLIQEDGRIVVAGQASDEINA
ncbi:MAG: hypothetical protein ACMV0I_00685, partial [Pseudomonas sp.]